MIKHDNNSYELTKSSLEKILWKIPGEKIIEFCLLCSIDCYRCCPTDPTGFKNNSIELIKEWLSASSRETKENIVSRMTKLRIENYELSGNTYLGLPYNSGTGLTYFAAASFVCIRSAIFAIFYLRLPNIHNVFYYTFLVLHYTSCIKSKEINKKYTDSVGKYFFLQEYANILKLYLTTTDFKHTDQSKSFLKNDTSKESISALLDYLIDNGEDIVIFQPDNKIKLNLPEEFNLYSKSMSGIVDIISCELYLKNYLKRLYS